VDMDVVPKVDRMSHLVTEVAKTYQVLLSVEAQPNGETYISTGWMMSAARHPFWDHTLTLLTHSKSGLWERMWARSLRHYDVLMTTGSMFLTKSWESYKAKTHSDASVLVLPQQWLRPSSVESSEFVTLVEGGPTWRDWDSTVAGYGQAGWRNRDRVLLGVVGGLLLVILLMAIVR